MVNTFFLASKTTKSLALLLMSPEERVSSLPVFGLTTVGPSVH